MTRSERSVSLTRKAHTRSEQHDEAHAEHRRDGLPQLCEARTPLSCPDQGSLLAVLVRYNPMTTAAPSSAYGAYRKSRMRETFAPVSRARRSARSFPTLDRKRSSRGKEPAFRLRDFARAGSRLERFDECFLQYVFAVDDGARHACAIAMQLRPQLGQEPIEIRVSHAALTFEDV